MERKAGSQTISEEALRPVKVANLVLLKTGKEFIKVLFKKTTEDDSREGLGRTWLRRYLRIWGRAGGVLYKELPR